MNTLPFVLAYLGGAFLVCGLIVVALASSMRALMPPAPPDISKLMPPPNPTLDMGAQERNPQDRVWMTVFRPDDSVPVRMWMAQRKDAA